MQTVIGTPSYLADARRAGIGELERMAIVDAVALHPGAGEEIVGSGGARKIRFGGRGKGKSGGYRVISFYSGVGVPVFLLNVFAKGDRSNLNPSEVNALKGLLGRLTAAYGQRGRKGISS
jgi:hypothetical protein